MAPVAVQVVFSPGPHATDRTDVVVEPGASLLDAIRASGVLARHPGIDLATQRVGIWGRACALEVPLADGDRVEIYRPLAADPKDARRARHRALMAAKRR